MAEKLKQRATLHAKLVDEFEKHNRNLSRFVEWRQNGTNRTLIASFYSIVWALEIRIHRGYSKLLVISESKRRASTKY